MGRGERVGAGEGRGGLFPPGEQVARVGERRHGGSPTPRYYRLNYR